jgi:two-component system, NtrC family, nitrogen regulation response regulator NtrX
VTAQVLIVEDDKRFAENLGGALKEAGYLPIYCADGTQAEEMLNQESIKLAFIDLALPGMNGMDLIERTKKSHPEIPLIMITGHASIENAVQAIQKGAYDFIKKPVSLDRLLITAANALEKHQLMTETRWQRQE